MRKICMINYKGGVGKTTTTVNLAAGLAMKGKRVLIVDLDTQGNVGTYFRVKNDKTVYDILIENEDPYQCIMKVMDNLDVITSTESLAKAELIMAGLPSRETIFRRAMENISGYDYVILDCPPSSGLLNQNALLFSNEAFIPVSADFLSMDALDKMIKTIEKTNGLFDHDIKVTAIIPTLFDGRNKICGRTFEKMRKRFNGEVTEPIRVNSKLKECPEAGQDIYQYAKYSRGSKDYQKLVARVIEKEFYH